MGGGCAVQFQAEFAAPIPDSKSLSFLELQRLPRC
jgi:hypothetical protein